MTITHGVSLLGPQCPNEPDAMNPSRILVSPVFRNPLLLGMVCGLALILAGCSKPDTGIRSSTPTTSPTAASGRPPLTNVYKVGPTIDLMERIDIPRDVVRGEFRLQDQSLTISGQQAQINIPVDVPDQYELLLEVARLDGNESLNIGFHIAGVTTSAVIEGWGRRVSALNLVDGKLGLNTETRSDFPVFKDTRPRKIRMIVRHESVLVDVDGGVFIDYRGSPARLSFDPRFFQPPARDQVMLGNWNSTFRVTQFTLTPLGDQPVDAKTLADNHQQEDAGKNDAPSRLRAAQLGSGNNSTSTSTNAEPNESPSSLVDSQPAKPAKPARDRRPEAEPAISTEPAKTEDDAASALTLTPWSAELDPSPWAESNFEIPSIRVEMDRGAALLPMRRSPFVCTIDLTGDDAVFQRFDLRTAQRVGEPLKTSRENAGDYQLSDSGRFLLRHLNHEDGTSVEVYDLDTGRMRFTADSTSTERWEDPRDQLIGEEWLLQLRNRDDRLHVTTIDLSTGEEVAAWSPEFRRREIERIFVTPGGRYLNIQHLRNLLVFEIGTGELVGQIAIPGEIDELLAVAFSSDASQLAAIASYDERPSSLTWVIDWKSGRTQLLADTGYELDSLHRVYKLGPALEWVPGNQLLLFYGRDLIDRETGRFFYRIPETIYWQLPRRAITPTRILAMTRSADPHRQLYRDVGIEVETLRDSLRVIRGGGVAADIGLPPLTVTEPGAVETYDLKTDVTPLRLEREMQSETSRSVEVPRELARMKDIRSDFRRIQIATSEPTIAVAHVQIESDRSEERLHQIVRYDLARGKATKSLPIRHDFELVDVGMEGRYALLGLANEVHAYPRLDIVDLTQGIHVLGWRPYADQSYQSNVDSRGQPEARDPGTVMWARFIDREQVVTVNPAGRLIVWKFPSCQAVFTVPDFGRPMALSRNRRYLAGTDGSTVSVLDLATPNVPENAGAAENVRMAGTLKFDDSPREVLRVAFNRECTELAVVLGYQGRRVLRFYGSSDGELQDQMELAYSLVSPGWHEYEHPTRRRIGLEYKRGGYLLLDDLYLIDRKRKTVPCSYHVRSGRHVVSSHDGLEWSIHQRSGSNRDGQYFDWLLQKRSIASDQVIQTIAQGNAKVGDRPIASVGLTITEETVGLNQN